MQKNVDYYEFLQISPHADPETIHRVYHFLATRFHPDNPDSGNADKFNVLKNAYDVLSDPTRRARYDQARENVPPQFVPLSTTIDFMDQMEGELNRRLGLLAVLYFRRRANPWSPSVPLVEVEKRMGFPREYLDFTTWYLERKGYINRADNSDFTLTADGVDFVESQRTQIPVLNRLLTATAGPISNGHTQDSELTEGNHYVLPEEASPEERRTYSNERRTRKSERRKNAPDLRANSIERRYHPEDRRKTRSRRGKPAENGTAHTTPER